MGNYRGTRGISYISITLDLNRVTSFLNSSFEELERQVEKLVKALEIIEEYEIWHFGNYNSFNRVALSLFLHGVDNSIENLRIIKRHNR